MLLIVVFTFHVFYFNRFRVHSRAEGQHLAPPRLLACPFHCKAVRSLYHSASLVQTRIAHTVSYTHLTLPTILRV